ENLAAARRFVEAVEKGASGDETAAFFTPDVVAVEFPNPVVPRGATRGLTEMREAAERGRRAMSAQRYDVRSAVASGDTVALEIEWTGTLAISFGSLAAGDEMRAHVAMFLQFRDGKICSVRNYDCYEPW
ncbi:MAG TPA: nuclear transport factor 2 family protein, partial [Longimicrobiaceae bacterium]